MHHGPQTSLPLVFQQVLEGNPEVCGRERTAGTGTQLWARAKSKWFEITPAESPDVESVLTWDLLGAAPFWRVMCAT